MRAQALFICAMISVASLAGCAQKDENQAEVVDQTVQNAGFNLGDMEREAAGPSYFLVTKETSQEDRQSMREIMLEFAVDFKNMFGMKPVPYTLVLYDTDDIHWFKDADKRMQPSTAWTFGFGSVAFFNKAFAAYYENASKENGGAAFQYDYEAFKPIIKHELTHFALYNTVYAGQKVPLDWSTSAPYGRGPIPDALDDGIADYLTTEGHRKARRDAFAHYYKEGFEFLPLAELFKEENIWVNKKNKDEIEGIETEIPGFTQEQIARSGVLMYNQGLMVFEYILEKGGIDFFRFMIAGYREYKDMDQILAEYGGKDDMPQSVAELDKQWWAEVRKTYGEPEPKAETKG